MAKQPKQPAAFVKAEEDVASMPATVESVAERPATGWRGEDYRLIIGRPDLSEEWRVPDPMQGDLRPENPEE